MASNIQLDAINDLAAAVAALNPLDSFANDTCKSFTKFNVLVSSPTNFICLAKSTNAVLDSNALILYTANKAKEPLSMSANTFQLSIRLLNRLSKYLITPSELLPMSFSITSILSIKLDHIPFIVSD